MTWFWRWKRRALAAEAELTRQRSSTITLGLDVNGERLASYDVRAISLESAIPGCENIYAIGNGASFVVDVPLEIKVAKSNPPHTPGRS